MFVFTLLPVYLEAGRLLLLLIEGRAPGLSDLAIATILLLAFLATALRRRWAQRRYMALAARLPPLRGTGPFTRVQDFGGWAIEDMETPNGASRLRVSADAQRDRLIAEDAFYHYHWWNRR